MLRSKRHLEDDDDTWASEMKRERVRRGRVDINEHGESLSLHTESGAGSHVFQGAETTGNARAHYGNSYHQENHFHHVSNTSQENEPPRLIAKLKFEGMYDRVSSVSPAYADTCRWILDQPEYLSWLDDAHRHAHNGVFWIKGNPGSGKSTLMKLLLSHNEKNNRDDAIASFFFNARSNTILPKSTEGMYRSLLCQIFTQMRQLESSMAYRFEGPTRDRWPIEILENCFRDTVKSLGQDIRLICYIDALDECDFDEARRAVECFEESSQTATFESTQFWICLASRYYPHIKMQKHRELRLDHRTEHLNDISLYVHHKLSITGPPELKQEIENEIQRRCSGAFLWVVLVVKIIKEDDDAGFDPDRIRAILNAVPDQLDELFASILKKPDNALVAALQWALFSRVPLYVDQLYFAIPTGVGDLRTALWNEEDSDMQRMKRYIIHRSRGLIEVMESSRGGEVQLIHESIREHLLSGGLAGMDESLKQNVEANSHARLSEWYQRYMKLGILEHYDL